MKLNGLYLADGAEIQEAVTDELKKVQKKEDFSSDFQKPYVRTKACIYANGAFLEWKIMVCVLHTSLQFLKQSVLKLLDRTVYQLTTDVLQ